MTFFSRPMAQCFTRIFFCACFLLSISGCVTVEEFPTGSYEADFSDEMYRYEKLADGEGCLSPDKQLKLLNQSVQALCVPVFYVTNRRAVLDEGSPVVFTDVLTGDLSFGISEVAVPLIYRENVRNPEKPGLIYKEKIQTVGALRKGDARSVNRLGITRISSNAASSSNPDDRTERTRFIDEVNVFAHEDANKSVLIFVNGFMQPFDESLYYAAKLSQDLAFNFSSQSDVLSNASDQFKFGIPIVFSWASPENAGGTSTSPISPAIGVKESKLYAASQHSVAVSGEDLASLIFQLTQQDLDNINIVAYSMGNRVLLAALDLLAEETFEPNGQSFPKINIIHAASDESAEETVSVYKALVDSNTLFSENAVSYHYVSGTDVTLSGSGLWNGSCRAGYENMLFCKRLTALSLNHFVIDATDFKAPSQVNFSSHAYFVEHPTILADAGCALSNILPGETAANGKRPLRLRNARRQDRQYWSFSTSEGAGGCLFTQPYSYGFECNGKDPKEFDECGKLLEAVRERAEEVAKRFSNLLGRTFGSSGNRRPKTTIVIEDQESTEDESNEQPE